jgi:hypothetical protein
MTKLLETALKKVAELPEAEQDAVARLILDELEDEPRWERAFVGSRERLARLADAAREEVRRGEVVPGDPATRDG